MKRQMVGVAVLMAMCMVGAWGAASAEEAKAVTVKPKDIIDQLDSPYVFADRHGWADVKQVLDTAMTQLGDVDITQADTAKRDILGVIGRVDATKDAECVKGADDPKDAEEFSNKLRPALGSLETLYRQLCEVAAPAAAGGASAAGAAPAPPSGKTNPQEGLPKFMHLAYGLMESNIHKKAYRVRPIEDPAEGDPENTVEVLDNGKSTYGAVALVIDLGGGREHKMNKAETAQINWGWDESVPWTGRNWYRHFNPFVGTKGADLFDSFAVGLSIEATPGVYVLLGKAYTNVDYLVPWYRDALLPDDPKDSDIPLFQHRDSDWCVGVGFDAEVWGKLLSNAISVLK
jgi:hypothetical protein